MSTKKLEPLLECFKTGPLKNQDSELSCISRSWFTETVATVFKFKRSGVIGVMTIGRILVRFGCVLWWGGGVRTDYLLN